METKRGTFTRLTNQREGEEEEGARLEIVPGPKRKSERKAGMKGGRRSERRGNNVHL